MAERIRWPEFWFLYTRTITQMRRGVVWGPFVIQGLIAFLLAAAHYYLFAPITGPLVAGWVRLIAPDYAPGFHHYPGHFILLPYYFGYARLIAAMFTEGLLFAVAIDFFASLHRGQPPLWAAAWKKALGRYLRLTIVWAIVLILLYLLNRYFFDFLQNVLGYSLESAPRRQTAMTAVLHCLTVLVYAPCLYFLPSLMLRDEKTGTAIRGALGLAWRHPFVTIGLVLLPYLVSLPLSWAASESAKIVSSFSPELVYLLIVLSILVDVPVNFVLVGTSAKFFLDVAPSES